MITEATGFLTAVHDVTAFCDKIIYLYRHPEERKAMGKAGKKFVINNFESSQVFERIEGYLLGGS